MKSAPSVQHLDPVKFDARLYRQMIDHLVSYQPNEGCGLIAFHGGRPVKLYPGTNVHPHPADHYRMDDNEVVQAINEMDREGWWLGGIYHSHPHSAPSPSSTDLREANWPDALMIIVSLRGETPQAEAYRLVDGAPRVVPLEVRLDWGSWIGGLRERVAASFIPRPADGLPHVATMSTGSLAASGSEQIALEIPRPPVGDGERRAVIGILGGMGPLATADLYTKIIQSTPASTDQGHIPVVIHADPRVPDRTEALLGRGEDPVPWLVHGARQLVAVGADFIVIPCNTAHAFLDEIRPAIDRPIVSMIEAAADTILEIYPRTRVVGLLATTGTIGSEMYQRALDKRGIDTIVPDNDIQRRCVSAAIAEVKAGRARASTTALLAEAAESLENRGADVLLAGCTEIPVVLQQRHVGVPLVDATDALAQLAVKTAIHLEEVARSGEPQWETSTIGWTAR